MATFCTMLRPITPTRRSCRTAASITCWMREISEAKVVTMMRPRAAAKMASNASPTAASDDRAGGRVQRDAHAVGDAVADAEELGAEAAELEGVLGRESTERDALGEAVLAQLDGDQAGGEAGGPPPRGGLAPAGRTGGARGGPP